jgi:DNA adenine methylase
MTRREDVRTWLRANGHADIAVQIDTAVRKWAREGKRTRRNWWDILAGDRNGNPRRVLGVVFPVIASARRRQQRKQSAGIVRNGHEGVTAKSVASPRGKAKKTGHRQKRAEVPKIVRGRPRPFVKWVGGKRQLLDRILKRVPKTFGTYHEPFLGGGAVFFALSPPNAFLSDSNKRLVRCYKGVRNHVADVISLLKGYRRNRPFFLEMRERDIDQATDAEVAAWFIFLNKTGFNGLYRVNSKNRFNVPYGDNKNAQICDEDNLMACHHALARAEVQHEDFSTVRDRAQPGDLVYFDPPYKRLSATSYFTSYTAEGFTEDDQVRLRNIALELKNKGVHVILSNSSSARSLYKDDFSLHRVFATRAVNSRADRRGKITELLIS